MIFQYFVAQLICMRYNMKISYKFHHSHITFLFKFPLKLQFLTFYTPSNFDNKPTWASKCPQKNSFTFFSLYTILAKKIRWENLSRLNFHSLSLSIFSSSQISQFSIHFPILKKETVRCCSKKMCCYREKHTAESRERELSICACSIDKNFFVNVVK